MKPTSARIVWAIAAKDILDALKNRTILVIIVGVLLLMLTGPVLLELLNSNRPTLVICGSGNTAFLNLATRDDLLVIQTNSQEEMESYLLQPGQTFLGVVILKNSGTELILDGYTAHWARLSKIRELATFFESALSEASGQTVHIDVNGHRVYPTETDGYQFAMIAISLITMIMVMGIALVPHLFIEEKETHTLDALLVSPASYGHLVAGKMIAGAVYGVLAAGIILGVNFRIILHWDLALTTMLLGIAFAAAFGLLLGMVFDNAASMGLWSGLITIGLLCPPLLEMIGSSRTPAWLTAVLAWLPSTALYNLAIQSMLSEVQTAMVWQGLTLLASITLVLASLVYWRIRHLNC